MFLTKPEFIYNSVHSESINVCTLINSQSVLIVKNKSNYLLVLNQMYKVLSRETEPTSLLETFITCYTTLQTFELLDSLLKRESSLFRVL